TGRDDRRGGASLRRLRSQPGHPRCRCTGRRDGSRPVIPASFDYVAPTSIQEALSALAEAGDDAKVLGGGQSLLPVLRMRLNAPEVLVDLGKVEELRGISEEDGHLVLGAMTTYADLLASVAVRQHAALLAAAVAEVADP